ncbi:MAG: hypothetical protein HOP08_19775 [Cyclobacteriaceae bacterium]|nr:hypothetical protein [Cyclobacteriaceae bacterium]
MTRFSLYWAFGVMAMVHSASSQQLASNDDPRLKKPTLLWTVDWKPDDRLIAVGGDDSLLRIYSAKDLTLVRAYKVGGMIRQMKWHPTESLLAIATHNDAISVLDISTNKTTRLNGIGHGARGIDWNYTGQLIATADNDGLVKIWSKEGVLKRTIAKEDDNSYFSIQWHPSRNILVASGDDIRIMDTTGFTMKTIRHRKENTGVLTLSWHPTGDYFASGDYGHNEEGVPSLIQLWKIDGSLISTLNGSKAEYRTIQWSKSGKSLASASDALRIWSNKGELLFTGRSSELLWGLDWNSTNEQIVTTGIRGTISLWTKNGKLIKSIGPKQ